MTRRSPWLAVLAALVLLGPVSTALPVAPAGPDHGGGEAAPSGQGTIWQAAHDRDRNGIDDEVEALAGRALAAGHPDEPIPVLIHYGEEPTREILKSLVPMLSDPGRTTVLRVIPTVIAHVPAAAIERLIELPGVQLVEHDFELKAALDISAPAVQVIDCPKSSVCRLPPQGPWSGVNNKIYLGRTLRQPSEKWSQLKHGPFHEIMDGSDRGLDGTGTGIAIIDTGVHDDHQMFHDGVSQDPGVNGPYVAPAFAGGTSILPDARSDEFSRCMLIGDPMGPCGSVAVPLVCTNPPDPHGHGTAVASVALGRPLTLVDGRRLEGVAPAARLIDIQISQDGTSTMGQLLSAIQWVLDYNVRLAEDGALHPCGYLRSDSDDSSAPRIDVVNLSFGASEQVALSDETEDAIDRLVENGTVFVASAGNCGPASTGCPNGGITVPATAAGAIAVANVMDAGTVDRVDDLVSSTSSRGRGSSVHSRLKPDIGAPGTNILVASRLGAPQDPETTDGIFRTGGIFASRLASNLAVFEASGTSVAAPHVAGIAALLIQLGDHYGIGYDDAVPAADPRGLRPNGTGFSESGSHASGRHPVRDALIFSADASVDEGPAIAPVHLDMPGVAGQRWTQAGGLASDSAPVTWNEASGYGEVNAFGAACWASLRYAADLKKAAHCYQTMAPGPPADPTGSWAQAFLDKSTGKRTVNVVLDWSYPHQGNASGGWDHVGFKVEFKDGEKWTKVSGDDQVRTTRFVHQPPLGDQGFPCGGTGGDLHYRITTVAGNTVGGAEDVELNVTAIKAVSNLRAVDDTSPLGADAEVGVMAEPGPGVQVGDRTVGHVHIQWDPWFRGDLSVAVMPTEYRVFRSYETGPYVEVGATSRNEFTEAPKAPGTYRYRVSAVDGAGCSSVLSDPECVAVMATVDGDLVPRHAECAPLEGEAAAGGPLPQEPPGPSGPPLTCGHPGTWLRELEQYAIRCRGV